jgi:hypothetical protein
VERCIPVLLQLVNLDPGGLVKAFKLDRRLLRLLLSSFNHFLS